MQASGASNETQLPRAVIRRGQAIQARIDANGKPASAAPAAAPADPAGAAASPTPPGPPAGPAPAAPAGSSNAPDPREQDPIYWRNRFKTVEGTLAADRARWAAERDRLHQELTTLQEQVRLLQAQQPAPAMDLTKLFTAEQIEKFGEDQLRTIVNPVLKVAREEAQALINQQVKPLQDQRTAEAQRVQEEQESRFVTRLTELVPDWAVINAQTEWLEWLAVTDEDTSEQRQRTLDRHHKNGNAAAVAKMFGRFKNETAPPPVADPPVLPHGDGSPGGDDTPPTPPGGALTVPTEKEIRDFTKRKATIKPGQRGYVTKEEAAEFDKRLKLKFAATSRR
jgi:hypothetical protein